MGRGLSKLSNKDATELSSNTYFSKSEVNKWHREFIKDCPSGQLNVEEFQSMYKHFFPQGDSSKFAALVFKVFDKNDDGYITFKEFICALSVTSRGTLEEKLDWAFGLYDLDGDGYITKAEMLEIVTALYAMVSGVAELEVPAACSPQQRVDCIFQLMDANNDGKLSKQEFKDGSMKDPWIVQALNMDLPSS